MKLNIDDLFIIYHLIVKEKTANRSSYTYYENLLNDLLNKIMDGLKEYEERYDIIDSYNS